MHQKFLYKYTVKEIMVTEIQKAALSFAVKI